VHIFAASMLTIVFVTMIYSVVLPLLNIITLFALAFSYIYQRLFLAYVVRQPPNYNTLLAENMLKYLKFAPIFKCISAIWAFDNQ